MPDNSNPDEPGNTTTGGTPPASQPATPPPALQPSDNSGGTDDFPDFVRDPKKALDYIKELRKEAGDHRKLANELKAWKEKQEADAKQQAEAQLKANQEFEKLAEQYKQELEAERANAKAANIQTLRVKIGAELSLPATLIERLRGETDEEIRKDATELKAAIPTPEPQPETPGRPRPSTTPMPSGATGETDAQRKARLLGRDGDNVFSKGVVRYHKEG